MSYKLTCSFQVVFSFAIRRIVLNYFLPFMFPMRSKVRLIQFYNKVHKIIIFAITHNFFSVWLTVRSIEKKQEHGFVLWWIEEESRRCEKGILNLQSVYRMSFEFQRIFGWRLFSETTRLRKNFQDSKMFFMPREDLCKETVLLR